MERTQLKSFCTEPTSPLPSRKAKANPKTSPRLRHAAVSVRHRTQAPRDPCPAPCWRPQRGWQQALHRPFPPGQRPCTEPQLSTLKRSATPPTDGNLSRLRQGVTEVTEAGTVRPFNAHFCVCSYTCLAGSTCLARMSEAHLRGMEGQMTSSFTLLSKRTGPFPTADDVLIYTVFRLFPEQEHLVHPLGTERCALCGFRQQLGRGAGRSELNPQRAALALSSSRAACQRFWQCPDED